jgi:hypothetical protein
MLEAPAGDVAMLSMIIPLADIDGEAPVTTVLGLMLPLVTSKPVTQPTVPLAEQAAAGSPQIIVDVNI